MCEPIPNWFFFFCHISNVSVPKEILCIMHGNLLMGSRTKYLLEFVKFHKTLKYGIGISNEPPINKI